MQSEHPSKQLLRDFMRGRTSAEQNRKVVRHLLTSCPQCQATTSQFWSGGGGREGEPRIDWGELGRMRERLEAERAGAPDLLAELQRHPPGRRLLLVRNLEAFQSWKFCELLLEHAFERGLEDPKEAEEWAELGVALAKSLSAERYGAAQVNDMRGRAFTVYGNALRINSNLIAAEVAFRKAERLLRKGTGDPLELGNTLHFKAILRNSQRAFSSALKLFNRATKQFRSAGDRHLVGRVLVDSGRTLAERGDHRGAIETLTEGLRLLDAKRDPRFVLVAKHNLTLYLQEAGETEKALRLLGDLLPLHAEYGRAVDRLYLRWLEARLIRAQGRTAAAAEVFEELRQTFIERSMSYDAALVSLDLAVVYLKEGRLRAVTRLAREMVATFRSLGVEREAKAAAVLFQEAAEQERITIAFLQELSKYLEGARSNPRLRFKPPE